MTDPNQIVPKLLTLKHKDLVRRLGATMAQIRVIERKQKEIAAERAALDGQDPALTRLSLQNGYGRYIQARSDALTAQIEVLRAKADTLQTDLRETIASQSILGPASQP